MAAKSAPYTCSALSNNVGLLLLCEVALGNSKVYYEPDYDAENVPKGFHSTSAVGECIPDPKKSHIIEKEIVVPTGKPIKNKDKKANRNHNEFIVYNVEQIRMRYLVKV